MTVVNVLKSGIAMKSYRLNFVLNNKIKSSYKVTKNLKYYCELNFVKFFMGIKVATNESRVHLALVVVHIGQTIHILSQHNKL